MLDSARQESSLLIPGVLSKNENLRLALNDAVYLQKTACSIQLTPSSQSRVNLVNDVGVRVCVPVGTGLSHDVRNLHLSYVGGTFLQRLASHHRLASGTCTYHYVYVESSANVPGYMAVERPDAGIVRVDLKNYIS